ncbi:MAG: histone deacetylase [Oscillochloris sp.]|nr:histone deacetylase [Oscillochloris sp.]
MSRVVVITDPACDAHTWHGHVERAERLQAIRRAIDLADLVPALEIRRPQSAAQAAVEAVHSARLLQTLRQLSSYGGGQIDADTYVTADSWDLAHLAAGAAIDAVEAIAGSAVQRAFALMRPPGHHATPIRSMGFCLINNIAVAARYALDRLDVTRVAIVDFDVHHGNGTQDVFYADPHVLFISSHAAPLYPGTGALDEIGDHAAAPGGTLNIPLPYGVGDVGYQRVYREVVAPALQRFQPELILVSAGYDSHWSDPIGPMALSINGFNRISALLIDLADQLCDGRIVFCLEGGYNLEALGAGVVGGLRLLLGRDPGADPLGGVAVREPDLSNVIRTVQQQHPLLRTE